MFLELLLIFIALLGFYYLTYTILRGYEKAVEKSQKDLHVFNQLTQADQIFSGLFYT